MKKVLSVIICLLCLFCFNVDAAKKTTKKTTKSTLPAVVEGKEKVKVYIFTKDGCPHCIEAKEFFTELEKTYGSYYELIIKEVYDSEWQVIDKVAGNTLNETYDLFEIAEQERGVPMIIIGSEFSVAGFGTATGDEIKKAIIKEYTADVSEDVVAPIIEAKQAEYDAEIARHKYDGVITLGILAGIVVVIFAISFISRKHAN